MNCSVHDGILFVSLRYFSNPPFCDFAPCNIIRDMEPYAVKSYLPYEHWTDEVKGPLLVKRLAEVFEEEVSL